MPVTQIGITINVSEVSQKEGEHKVVSVATIVPSKALTKKGGT